MKSIMNLALVLLFFISTNALAKTEKVTVKNKKTVAGQSKAQAQVKQKAKAKLGTSFKFDATTLRGKHLSAFGTNATVENDKYLEELLAGRKDFNDRMQDDQNRN